MARRTYRKRYNYRRKKFTKKAAAGGSGLSTLQRIGNVAWTGLKIASKVASMVNAESKYFDISTVYNPDYTCVVNPICYPAIGDTDQQRNGSLIKLQNLTLRMSIQGNSAGGAGQQVRVIIFRWKQPNAQSIVGSNVLALTGSSSVILAPKSWDDRFQFKFLYDKTFQVTNGSTTNDGAPLKRIVKAVIPLNFHTKFNSTTTSIESGGLYALICSNLLTNMPGVVWYSRVTYLDN